MSDSRKQKTAKPSRCAVTTGWALFSFDASWLSTAGFVIGLREPFDFGDVGQTLQSGVTRFKCPLVWLRAAQKPSKQRPTILNDQQPPAGKLKQIPKPSLSSFGLERPTVETVLCEIRRRVT